MKPAAPVTSTWLMRSSRSSPASPRRGGARPVQLPAPRHEQLASLGVLVTMRPPLEIGQRALLLAVLPQCERGAIVGQVVVRIDLDGGVELPKADLEIA